MGDTERSATPLVIGLAGRKGSGKTTIASALAACVGATVASFGAYVRTQVSGPTDATTLADVGAELLARMGAKLFLRRTIEAAGWDGQSPLIIEGVRHVEILTAIREEFPQTFLVFITAPDAERIRRLERRDELSQMTIAALASHSTETEVPLLQRCADYVADGTGETSAIAAAIADVIAR